MPLLSLEAIIYNGNLQREILKKQNFANFANNSKPRVATTLLAKVAMTEAIVCSTSNRYQIYLFCQQLIAGQISGSPKPSVYFSPLGNGPKTSSSYRIHSRTHRHCCSTRPHGTRGRYCTV